MLPMIRSTRQQGTLAGFLTVITLLGTAGCGMFPSDPADPPQFGATVDGDTIVVKIPMCPTDEIKRVEVYDFDDVKHENPRVVWSASGPNSTSTREGLITLWSGEGFAKHSEIPSNSSIPPNIGVSYRDPKGDGRGDVFARHTIESAKLEPGKYWTRDGPMTAKQIDAQLHCSE
ncbi:hypothetical protein [Streptomyces sp. ME18-1-4]|uniref:hypothetical protein n=1 Tax=Streptomyces sp. ME18-1-4 TaxID=3028685 RepID=UPI0029AC3CB5|nr:hypothetical protein [Streptomyces sp. ME18-1-4]MDX3240280.1 hypothetical protein [Streptomyces sp. ME18-1-4]